MVFLEGDDRILSLAEVQVFGEASDEVPDTTADVCQCASGESSLLVNGSFEETSNPLYDSAFDLIEDLGRNNNGVRFVDRHLDTDFPGWFTTGGNALQQGGFSQGGTLELGQSGFLGVEAPDGRVFAEMDGNDHNQLVSVTPGQVLDWELSHRGRPGTDEITIAAGPVGNQSVIAVVTSPNTEWIRHTGQYQVPAGVTQIQFTIIPSGAANGDIDSSNLLDFVKVCPSNDLAFASQVDSTRMTLFPNPVGEVLFMNSESVMPSSTALVQIYSGNGNLVQAEQVVFANQKEASLYVGGLKTGVYTVMVLDPITGQLSVLRMIKK